MLCTATFGAWFLGVAEFLGILIFAPWAFRIGPIAIRREERLSQPNVLGEISTFETADVKCRVLEGHSCIFRGRFGVSRWHTPFEIRGEMSWKDGTLRTVGRYSMGVTLFFLAGLILWTFGSMLMIRQAQGTVGALMLFLGPVFVGGISYLFCRFEKGRFSGYSDQLKRRLFAGTPGAEGTERGNS